MSEQCIFRDEYGAGQHTSVETERWRGDVENLRRGVRNLFQHDTYKDL